MHRIISILLFFVLATAFIGCGDTEKAETANTNTRASNTRARTSADRDRPSEASVRGTASGDASTTKTPDSVGSAVADSNKSDSSFNNGLFPKMAADRVASFGGALFPDFQPGGTVDNNEMADAASDSDPFDLGDDFFDDADTDSEMVSTETSSETVSVETTSTPVSLLPDAKRLFENHSEEDAINVLYANHLVSDEARSTYALNWYPGLKEPRLLFRWGVGVVYNQPRDFEGRHPVIGDPGDENESVASGGGGDGGRTGRNRGGSIIGQSGGGGGNRGARTYKNIDTTRPDGFLLYYTGDFGEKLISFLDARRKDEDEPYYGQVLKDVLEVELPEAQEETNAGRRGNRPASNRRGGAISSFGGGNLGGESGGSRGGARGGSSPQPVVRTDTSVLDRAMGRTTAEKPDDDFAGSITPGVMLLGVGSKSDLVERAQAANLDALIIFNVKVTQSRRSSQSNRTAPSRFSMTSMKIIDIKNGGKNLFSSKALKDTTVKEKNEDGEDLVAKEVERAFKSIADKEFKASDLPSALNPVNVKKRIGRILKDKPDNPLPAAVEIVSFHDSQLLPDDLAITALQRLFDSDEAEVLINGSAASRLAFVKNWLPDSIDL